MKNKAFKIVYGFLLFFILSQLAICSDNNFDELMELEGFLDKNKSQMTMVGKGKYTVEDDQFDKIFPFSTMVSEEDISQPNYFVGYIKNVCDDILSSNIKIKSGTGTIIKNNVDEVWVLTAAHLFNEIGDITFTLGSSRVTSGLNQINHIAEYKASAIFQHDTEDLVVVNFSLLSTTLKDKSKLKNYFMQRSHDSILSKKKASLVHYPFAVKDQRINTGFILETFDLHTIPSLGGSSGAPLIINEKIIGIHSGAVAKKGGNTEYKGKILDFYTHNSFVRLSDIKEDLSEFNKKIL